MIAPTTLKLKGLQQQRVQGQTVTDYFEDWDWLGHIKPQIDMAVSVGANALKWFVGPDSVALGGLSRATWLSRIDQFIDYTDGLGLYLYLTLLAADDAVGLNAAVQTEIVAVADHLSSRTRIVGYDMGNEINHDWPEESVFAYLEAIRPRLLAVTDVPLSVGQIVYDLDEAFGAGLTKEIGRYCDFIDFHPYWNFHYQGNNNNLTARMVRQWWKIQPHYKPWVVGECGRLRGDTAPTPAERWESLGDLARTEGCFGAFGYTTQKHLDAPNDWAAIFDTDGSGPDTALSGPFSRWPARSA